MTRPLCPYPQFARYKGKGDTNDAANFECVLGAARASSEDGEVFSAFDPGVARPKVLSAPAPAYPEKAQSLGIVVVSTVVGIDGHTHDVQVLRSLEPVIDADAIQTVKQWTFKPAMKDGKPVAFRMNVEMDYTKGASNWSMSRVFPVSDPTVMRPRPLKTPEPEYSESARKKKIQGTVTLSIIVGGDGHTHDVKVVDSLEPSLDSQAVDAVKHWRFAPCTKDGKPVACQMKVEVAYHLYERP